MQFFSLLVLFVVVMAVIIAVIVVVVVVEVVVAVAYLVIISLIGISHTFIENGGVSRQLGKEIMAEIR